jgi:hypothetical protein
VELGESQEKHDAKVEETAQESICPVATRQRLLNETYLFDLLTVAS